MFSAVLSDLRDILEMLYQEQAKLSLYVGFVALVCILIVFFDEFPPALVAIALVFPLHLLLRGATAFGETDYERVSPILANLGNHRFMVLTVGFSVIPLVYWYLKTGVGWNDFGVLARAVTAVSVFVLAWSESLYQKNIYFARWHLVERVGLVFFGGLTIYNPVFAPLFLLVHGVITTQFQYPRFDSFNQTHITLPYTLLLVVSAVVFTGPVIDLQPATVTFLLLSVYASNYFYSGVEKISYGPLYYLRHNNPIFLFSNAYQIGWMSFIDEKTVVRILSFTDRVKLILNLAVVLIEMGVVFVLVSPQAAIAMSVLLFSLHLLIFVSTGDLFWRWMAVNVSVIVGVLMAGDDSMAVFGDPLWIALLVSVVVLSPMWMNPKRLGWLDSPYLEYFEFKGETADGETVKINPTLFRPYNDILTQGATGKLTYLSENPRFTYSFGNVRDRALHATLMDTYYSGDVDDTNLLHKGDDEHDEAKVEQLEKLLKIYLSADINPRIGPLRLYEFYSVGLSSECRSSSELEAISIESVEGSWTESGFYEHERNVVLRVRYPED